MQNSYCFSRKRMPKKRLALRQVIDWTLELYSSTLHRPTLIWLEFCAHMCDHQVGRNIRPFMRKLLPGMSKDHAVRSRFNLRPILSSQSLLQWQHKATKVYISYLETFYVRYFVGSRHHFSIHMIADAKWNANFRRWKQTWHVTATFCVGRNLRCRSTVTKIIWAVRWITDGMTVRIFPNFAYILVRYVSRALRKLWMQIVHSAANFSIRKPKQSSRQ